nr:immunoglobulin heavy chain junction region [Macaca mulatta]
CARRSVHVYGGNFNGLDSW